jgi:hypothetical protein
MLQIPDSILYVAGRAPLNARATTAWKDIIPLPVLPIFDYYDYMTTRT